jgi:hypothetical protein
VPTVLQRESSKRSQSKKRASKARKSQKNDKVLPLVAFVPSAKRILMTFSNSHSITESAVGLGATYFYRLNSPYDPDATGVGSSAIGYTTWSGLFLNYKVRRVTVRVQGAASGMTGAAFANVTIAPVANQPVVPANKQTWKMMRGAKIYAVSPVANGGRNIIDHTANYDNAWIAEVTKQQYDVDMDFSGQVGSNPARQNYIMIAVDSVLSTSAATLAYNIQITYEVEWFNPVPMQ